MNDWRRYSGSFAWPTLLLAGSVVVGELGVWVGVGLGILPLWVGSLLCVGLAYAAFTPLHEACHGNIHGRYRRWRWLGPVVGWSMGLFLLGPFSAFQVLHLRHHAKTNDPEADPDLWVKGRGLGVVLRCATISLHYYALFLSRPGRSEATASAASSPRSMRRDTVLCLLLLAGLATLGSLAGFALEVLFLWIVPALLALGMLAFAFDWLPHHPHRERGRMRDTRVVEAGFPLRGLLSAALFAQNYHLIHHLYPRVPFYRYGQVFRAMRPQLVAEGARIDRLGLRGRQP